MEIMLTIIMSFLINASNTSHNIFNEQDYYQHFYSQWPSLSICSWRLANPNECIYTCKSTHNTFSRIDRVYTSIWAQNDTKVRHEPFVFSDHINAVSGVWQLERENFADISKWWDAGKHMIQLNTRQYCNEKRRHRERYVNAATTFETLRGNLKVSNSSRSYLLISVLSSGATSENRQTQLGLVCIYKTILREKNVQSTSSPLRRVYRPIIACPHFGRRMVKLSKIPRIFCGRFGSFTKTSTLKNQ